MIKIEHKVTAITIPPFYQYDKWHVGVEARYYRSYARKVLTFDTEVEARSVGIGYIFSFEREIIIPKAKALSVRQPWAYLICSGIKPIENRTWDTNFRGTIYIHACSKIDDKRGYTDDQWSDLIERGYKPLYMGGYLKYSAIIGHVDIIDCVHDHTSIWAEKGVSNWVLENPVLFDEPIKNVRGALNLWDCSKYINR